MIWLVEGIYIAAMLCGITWLIRRIVTFARSAGTRKEAEARWAQSFSEDEFQSFLETLRQKRDSQANELNENSRPNNPQSDKV